MSHGQLKSVNRDTFPILVIDDDRPTAELFAAILKNAGYEVRTTHSLGSAREELGQHYYPIVLCDINLGHGTGLDLLSAPRETSDPQLFIFITGEASVDTTMTAIRAGAFDYLSKPTSLEQLEIALLDVVRRAEERLLAGLSIAHPVAPCPHLRRIVGKSPEMVRVYRALATATLHKGNVLILGETGTGKEQIARTIHDNSALAAKPFVAVNCAALSDTLLESELFGHVKGAFTGATGNKRGLFEEASDGTIFLDEIGEVSPSLQVKLLRTLQEKEIKPVGSSETRKINVRVIAATNRNLEQAIKDLTFREDFYYRLNVFSIRVPPLRERVEDLPELVDYFIASASASVSKQITGLAQGVLELLLKYPWPGNIRELENAVFRAVTSARSSVLFPVDFPAEITRGITSDFAVRPLCAEAKTALPEPPPLTLAEIEREHIYSTLRRVNFKKIKAAEILGIDRVTLYRKLERYGIPTENDFESKPSKQIR